MRELTFAQAIREAITEEMRRDPALREGANLALQCSLMTI